jgi:hypothetical protein
MFQIKAAARLKVMAAKEKMPSKKAVQNWLVKHYGFQPGYGAGDSNPYSNRASDVGYIKDKPKLRALMAELERVGEKGTVPGYPESFNYTIGKVYVTVNTKTGQLWVSTPKKAKLSLRFSPYD